MQRRVDTRVRRDSCRRYEERELKVRTEVKTVALRHSVELTGVGRWLISRLAIHSGTIEVVLKK